MTELNRGDLREIDKRVSEVGTSVARLEVQVRNLERIIEDLVTKAEFAPVKLIAYGLASGAMSAVVMAIISKVILR